MNDLPRTLIARKRNGPAEFVLTLDEWAGCALKHWHGSGKFDFPMTRLELRELYEQIFNVLERRT